MVFYYNQSHSKFPMSKVLDNENVPIFLEAVRQQLPFLKQQDDERLSKRIGSEKVLNAADDLAGYILSGVSSKMLNKQQRLALSCQLLKCLVRYLNDGKIPLTLNTFIDRMGLLQYAVEQSFPGYADSGLLLYMIMPQRRSA